jgi:hypothetical protein
MRRQYFFNENKVNVGVEIVPCHNIEQQMSTDVASGEQLVYDIERLIDTFPSCSNIHYFDRYLLKS